ncbi:MAG: restriction endonuclease [Candidatus Aenigmarchaeota archaeon]|nr:restriction endonuclease [Candidatus Aenigmarchaeota archaeon]
MLQVIKASGVREKFEKQKIINTCLRMGASKEVAERVAEKVYKKSYQGIPTKKILKLTFKFLGKYKPEIKFVLDLREAVSKLRPTPDFEQFVRLLLKEQGYKVSPARFVRGKCIKHEIDGIVRKGKEILYLEVKHHVKFHARTPLEVPLSVWATLDDLKDGFRAGYHKINFTGALIVCNTKFSTYARNYALAKGIRIISWDFPANSGLKEIIKERNLYPITMVKDLDKKVEEKLGNRGIVLLKQLVETDAKLLAELKVEKRKISSLIGKAKKLLASYKK